ncbi:D-alanyl-D-alanine carboxypeptidase [Christiangramia salexigens]|uniref:D-alanyl-D-alanine carboxypeptidase n=1 Tax=Christiangramia salexigens TaxID=1913577 RepID=A0A1L3J807_9FLAO|nr:D-alanyl-D-alanine carboxypeptidase [Christiangramia salexigens]APG61234.1 hypothetical protein LPB144_12830 [Christiangramia salexigens]
MNTNSFNYIILCLISLVILNSCAPGFKKVIKKDKVFKQAQSALIVYDPAAKKTLFEYNADKYFTPASNTKILTFYAGLKSLNDSVVTFKYSIKGDSLIFSSTGDPSFLNPKFNDSTAHNFLKTSKRKLYYINSNWNDEFYGPGWAWDDYNYAFAAERSAFPIYGNLVTFKHENQKEELLSIPSYFQDCVHYTDLVSTPMRSIDANLFHLPKDVPETYSRQSPFKTSQELSLQLLSDSLKKPIQVIKNDASIILDKELKTISMDTLYKEMLHESDNFIAEQILLMAAHQLSDTLKAEKAINNIKKSFLKGLKDEIYWVDGSGLSRYNLLTPRSLVFVLDKIHQERSEDDLTKLFPTGGSSGTLKGMFTETPAFIFAKSGSLRNNYSLSGYMISRSGKFLIFSFMNSNYTQPSQLLKTRMEEILTGVRNKY